MGTNLLTVTNGQDFFGRTAELSPVASGMIARIGPVTDVQQTGAVTANVYRNQLIPAVNTNALSVKAASLDLLGAVGTSVVQGQYLNAATAQEPVAVLGATAAQRLGIDELMPGERIWLGGQWFYVAGILNPAPLATEIDTSVLIGFPAAETYLHFDGNPSTIYVRAATDQVTAVQSVLASTVDPESPNEVSVSRPSDALVVRAAAKSAFSSLFLGLGAVSLLVGAIGVANIMVISVLERRSEIGLRRSLGATQGSILIQFLTEAILLGALGGIVGVLSGVVATAGYDAVKGGSGHSAAGLGGRVCRGARHWGDRWTDPRRTRGAPFPHRGPAHGVSVTGEVLLARDSDLVADDVPCSSPPDPWECVGADLGTAAPDCVCNRPTSPRSGRTRLLDRIPRPWHQRRDGSG